MNRSLREAFLEVPDPCIPNGDSKLEKPQRLGIETVDEAKLREMLG